MGSGTGESVEEALLDPSKPSQLERAYFDGHPSHAPTPTDPNTCLTYLPLSPDRQHCLLRRHLPPHGHHGMWGLLLLVPVSLSDFRIVYSDISSTLSPPAPRPPPPIFLSLVAVAARGTSAVETWPKSSCFLSLSFPLVRFVECRLKNQRLLPTAHCHPLTAHRATTHQHSGSIIWAGWGPPTCGTSTANARNWPSGVTAMDITIQTMVMNIM